MTDATSFVTPFLFELEVLLFLMNFCVLMQFAFLEILESISEFAVSFSDLQSISFVLTTWGMSGFSNETVAARMSLEHSPRGGVFGIGHANTGQAQSVCCQVSG